MSEGFEESEQDPSFISDEALAALKDERSTLSAELTDAEFARQLFQQAAPEAAMHIIHLAKHSTNDATRLRAAQYVIERVMGAVGSDTFETVKSPIEGFIQDVTEYVAQAAESE